MSDGPYKTLPMRAKWKALAKRAYIQTFTDVQASQMIGPALGSDWRNEVSAPFVSALQQTLIGGDQGTLFYDHVISDVEAFRARCVSPMEASLVDCALDALAEGARGHEAVELAVEGALESRLLSGARQVEEHLLRDASRGRSAGVRARLEAAVRIAPLRAIAREILSGQRGPVTRAPSRHFGLDEGVPL